MGAGLRADRIQGNVFPGFNKDQQAFLGLRFPAAESARAWLQETVSELTSAREVIAFRALRAQRAREPGLGIPRSTWVNLAFSRAGLRLLESSEAGTFPEAFEQGMAGRAARLGDTPDSWRFGGTPETEAHALVIIGADTLGDLQQAVGFHRERVAHHGARDLFLEVLGQECRGAKLPGALRGHEHFGYRDGVATPGVDGSPGTGDFVLGYPGADGRLSRSGPAWSRDGSYLVFRRLRQDVAGFHRALHALVGPTGLKNRAQVGAKLVGRWPSGAKLEDPIAESDPGAATPTEYTVEELAADPAGRQVPGFAHVRKADPHGAAAGDRRPRLLRRGVPYGPPLPAAEGSMPVDDGRDRGLLFVAYQGDIANQYELVQRWLNDRNLPAAATGQDPIAGQGEDPARLTLCTSNAPPSTFDMHHYVTMTGGGYFFAPSVTAARFLADPTTTWEQQEAIMGNLDLEQLCALIGKENPYGTMTEIDLNGVVRSGFGAKKSADKPYERVFQYEDEGYRQGLFWTVGTAVNSDVPEVGPQPYTVRVSKAVRIPYKIGTRTYHLLVGYEGAGGI
jgi:Dyp-type peroxidase family